MKNVTIAETLLAVGDEFWYILDSKINGPVFVEAINIIVSTSAVDIIYMAENDEVYINEKLCYKSYKEAVESIKETL